MFFFRINRFKIKKIKSQKKFLLKKSYNPNLQSHKIKKQAYCLTNKTI